MTKTFGEFKTANAHLDDRDTLRATFDEQGYLFFRDVLDTSDVEAVKSDLVEELRRQGYVEPGCTDPIWTGKDLSELDDERLYALDYYAKLLDADVTQAFFRNLFGEPTFTFRSCSLRYSMPKDESHGAPPHQDHFFVNHTTDFRTMWIPLMDLDVHMGGLAIAEGSHKRGLCEHVEQDVLSYVLKGRKQKGVDLENITEPWLTGAYRTGDVLMFHPHMLHWGTLNRSDRIRLSIDVRVQPASSPRSMQTDTTLLQQRQFRADVHEAALQEGASPEMFERLVIEMMARRVNADRNGVREVLAEMSEA